MAALHKGGFDLKYFVELTDERNKALHKLLTKQGVDTHPMEYNNAGTYIFSPAKRFALDEALAIPKSSIVFSGNLKDEIKQIFDERKITHINFLDFEDFAVKNAVLTAEGTLPVLIKETPASIYEQKVLILGLGRIGKALAILFDKLGIDYTCMVTPRELDSANIYAKDYFLKEELLERVGGFDTIVNTIPVKVFEDGDLKYINDEAVFIELASNKCLDDTKAKFKFVWALALPTKYMPMSAARLMDEVIMGFGEHMVDIENNQHKTDLQLSQN